MRRVNAIALNLYDEAALKMILNHVINTEYNNFISVSKAHSFKNVESTKNAKYLQYFLPPDLKDHPYAAAKILLMELENAQDAVLE